MVLPLVHSSLPVMPSSTYSTAGVERSARAAAVRPLSSPRYSPLDAVIPSPLTTMGDSGEAMSRVQPLCSDTLPPSSASFQATMPLPDGETIQRVVPSSQVASAAPAPVLTLAPLPFALTNSGDL